MRPGETSTAALPAPRSPRYLTLDHWRGIACLLVVVFHSTSVWSVAGAGLPAGADLTDVVADLALRATRIGWIGVPIFFVISGYAISATADASRRREHGVRNYAWRRFRRIYPPYWAMLVLQIGLVLAIDLVLVPRLLVDSPAPIGRPWRLDADQWLGNVTLIESWRYHLPVLGGDREWMLGQAWTLAYEEQFYLVMGALLLFVPRRLFAAAAIVTVGVLVTPFVTGWLNLPVDGFFFDGHWLIFAAGILIYRQVNYGSRNGMAATWLLLGLGVVYSLRNVPDLTDLDQFLLTGFLFGGLLLAMHRADRRLHGMPRLAPIRFLGTICYSLYLSHAIVVRSISTLAWNAGVTDPVATAVLVVPICVVTALLVGTAFHRLVERHFISRTSVVPAPAPSMAPATT